MKIWKIILLLFVIFLIILNLRYNNKTNNKLTILQLTNPHKQIFEENIKQLSPSIIVDVIEPNFEVDNFNLKYLQKKNIDKNIKLVKQLSNSNTETIYTSYKVFIDWISKNDKIKTKDIFYLKNNYTILKDLEIYSSFDKFAKYYIPPMTLSNRYSLTIENKFVKPDIERVDHTRFLICQMQGTRKYYLFNPEQEKYLYKNKSYTDGVITSQIDFWNYNSDKYPDYNKSQYMEIIIRENQMIYIPKFWWFCYENTETSITISIESTYFTDYISNIKKLI